MLFYVTRALLPDGDLAVGVAGRRDLAGVEVLACLLAEGRASGHPGSPDGSHVAGRNRQQRTLEGRARGEMVQREAQRPVHGRASAGRAESHPQQGLIRLEPWLAAVDLDGTDDGVSSDHGYRDGNGRGPVG